MSKLSLHHCVFCGLRFQEGEPVVEYDLRCGCKKKDCPDRHRREVLRYHDHGSCRDAATEAEAGGWRAYFIHDPVESA